MTGRRSGGKGRVVHFSVVCRARRNKKITKKELKVIVFLPVM